MAKEKKKKSRGKKFKALKGASKITVEEQLEESLSEYETSLEPIELRDTNTIFLLPDVSSYGYSKTNVILAYMLFPRKDEDKAEREAFLRSFERKALCENLLADEWSDHLGHNIKNKWPMKLNREDIELLAFDQRPEDVQVMSKNETYFRYGYLAARSLEFMYCLLEAKNDDEYRYEGRISPGLLPYYLPLEIYNPLYEMEKEITKTNKQKNKGLLHAKKKKAAENAERKKGRKLSENELSKVLGNVTLSKDEKLDEEEVSPLRKVLTNTPPRTVKAFRQLRGKYQNVAHLWAAYFDRNGKPIFDVYGNRKGKKVSGKDLFKFLARAEEIRKMSEERGAFDAMHQSEVPASPYKIVPLADVHQLNDESFKKHLSGDCEDKVISALLDDNFQSDPEFWQLSKLWNGSRPLEKPEMLKKIKPESEVAEETRIEDSYSKQIRLNVHFETKFSNKQRKHLEKAREEYIKANESYPEDVRSFLNQKVEKWSERKSQSAPED
ncbi:hypothetical protein MTBPR1_140042 [Candidatus Terasakiella magnetica]|uniref:Uncharacterized protein n=1 Tax=Candidatus Terasakiella magnetica TaxID=1867952 RepID=A0A1C3RFD5_9PROT|nr:hypothetical protein [Candidatus Terasakiella magnetica]SCA55924.1 hypothetical protein MTBPR1_140042 [Candidatus Terasakiella magnetica]